MFANYANVCDDLRDLIEQAFSEQTPLAQLVEDIRDAGTFSEARAEMIAATEVSRAQVEGNLSAWRETGAIVSVDVVLAGDHEIDDECDDIADGGPYSIDDVPDVPIHPNCGCLLVAADLAEG